MAADQPDGLSPTKRALLALKELQAKLDALEQARTEPIAIVGLGCRFPGGADAPDRFWEVLHREQDAITEVPGDRWNPDDYTSADPNLPGCPRWGGFVPHLWDFDAPFFRMAPREALSLDPQQRLLLEVSWEALEQGAIAPDSLNGSPAGVFVGICSIDYWHQLLQQHPDQIDAYLTTGNTHSVAAGRLSYLLGLTGPSLAVDTACSSSLVAVHLACQSLRNGECHLALAGGVNRILSPEAGINFARARMVSPDGRCRSFDAEANGFVRAEGCGMVVLKRLRDAQRDGDRIHALILGSAVNHDGRTSGLTVPNGPAQQALIRQALDHSHVLPEQVGFLEAHGTGTALGDPIEINALGAVFAGDRPPGKPLVIGSVKPTIGHLEAASGIAGLLKAVLALEHGQIPPNLHFHSPNPHVPWAELPIQVPTKPMPWPVGSDRRIAGVSAFGFSGTNAHVILAAAPATDALPTDAKGWQVLVLSARDEKALRQLAERYQTYLQAHPDLYLGDLCRTAAVGRSHLPQRLALVVQSVAEVGDRLTHYRQGEPDLCLFEGRAIASVPAPGQPETQLDGTLEGCHRVAERYITGQPLDWTRLYPASAGRLIPLPTYPFQRQPYRLIPQPC